ncbi:MAG: hypothetical protein RL569_1226 [Actinomycetota bacterium]|jgi:hypothetical protein
MKQYSEEEIEQLLEVKGGDAEDQAAALAVVTAAIIESRRLGRIALRKPGSSWHRNQGILRGELSSNWHSSSRPGL